MSRRHSTGQIILTDFFSGILATLPMTLLMLAANKAIPTRKPDPLPPEEVTVNLTKKAQVEPLLSDTQKKKLSLFNHFFYGGFIAVPIGLITAHATARQSVNRGVGYGLLVWLSNYLGLLPSLNLYPPATREPARMNGIMIASHLLWGGSLGWLSNRLHRAIAGSG